MSVLLTYLILKLKIAKTRTKPQMEQFPISDSKLLGILLGYFLLRPRLSIAKPSNLSNFLL